MSTHHSSLRLLHQDSHCLDHRPMIYEYILNLELNCSGNMQIASLNLLGTCANHAWEPDQLKEKTKQYTVKPVLSCHSKIDKTKMLMTNGSLMKVESIAECSPWSILQYFWPALSDDLSWKNNFGLLFEWPLKIGFIVVNKAYRKEVSEPCPEHHSSHWIVCIADQCNHNLACDIVPQTKSQKFGLPQLSEVYLTVSGFNCFLFYWFFFLFRKILQEYHQCQPVWFQIMLYIFVAPDLGPNCLQIFFSAEDTSVCIRCR